MPFVGVGGALSFPWFIFIWAHVVLDTKLKRKMFWIPSALLYYSPKWCEVKGSWWLVVDHPFQTAVVCYHCLTPLPRWSQSDPIAGYRASERTMGDRMVEAALNSVWQLGVFEGIKPIWGFLQLLAAWGVRWEKYLSRNKYFLTESMPQKRESWFWRIPED